MMIDICKTKMAYPSELGELRDCNALLDDMTALHQRMAEDGYLLIRSFHERPDMVKARETFLEKLEEQRLQYGQLRDVKAIAREPAIMAILESPRLFAFFERYFGEPARTFDEKWLRVVGRGVYTGLHYDNVYMGRGSKRLHTVWTPFGDLSMQLGTLAICVGSHTERFRKLQETYGRMDVDRDKIKGSWYSNDPREVTAKFGGEWKTSTFELGDIIVMGMHTMHCSTTNVTDQLRLSCDIRYQPASEPADERWVGETRLGHTGEGPKSADAISIEQAKEQWGV